MAVGKINVEVTMKKINSRKITSVIDDMEKVSSDGYCFLRAMLCYLLNCRFVE